MILTPDNYQNLSISNFFQTDKDEKFKEFERF